MIMLFHQYLMYCLLTKKIDWYNNINYIIYSKIWGISKNDRSVKNCGLRNALPTQYLT